MTHIVSFYRTPTEDVATAPAFPAVKGRIDGATLSSRPYHTNRHIPFTLTHSLPHISLRLVDSLRYRLNVKS